MTEQLNQAEATPVIINDSDRRWFDRNYDVLSQNQTGSITGHYMKVDGSTVVANGLNRDKAHFKIHVILDSHYNKIVMLESTDKSGWVVAIDKDNDKVIAKQAPQPLSKYNELKDVAQSNPELLFYQKPKAPGSDICYYESYLTDQRRILGFNDLGEPLSPSKVDHVQVEAHFRVIAK